VLLVSSILSTQASNTGYKMNEEDEVRDLRTKLVLERAQRIQDFDDAYPDVGMGMSWGSCVADAMKELGYTRDQLNLDKKKT
jgi:hypothetical protein